MSSSGFDKTSTSKSRNTNILNFFKPRNVDSSTPSSSETTNMPQKRSRVEFNPNELIVDPGLRPCIDDYDVGIRDQVRRQYLLKGPCQPYGHNFPKKKQATEMRSFIETWFKKFIWLEYSVEKDAAFCLYCYLFASPGSKSETFTRKGFSNWKKATENFNDHVGAVSSVHNDARRHCEDFQNQRQSISHVLTTQSREMENAYRTRLTAVLEVVRILLWQGLAFRGHDETLESLQRGNFLEVVAWYAKMDETVRNVIGGNAPGNNQLTSPKIQKELVSSCASQVTLAILTELGDRKFSLLVDEARDCSVKEQMAVMIRFVNKKGEIIERFLAIEHVSDTSSRSLKAAVDMLFARHNLSISRLRGQAYDGASNMRGEFNGLKALIQRENPFAFYVHCFAHQLQLVIVAISKHIPVVAEFFTNISMIVTIAGASCKRRDELNKHRDADIFEKLETDELTTGKGLNQQTNLARPSDTRWGTHHVTLARLLSMWSSALYVLERVYEDGIEPESRGKASALIKLMEDFHFVFILHLMLKLLGITNALSLALQQKDQNIVNAMNLIEVLKVKLQNLRDSGWDALIHEVTMFCNKHGIVVPDMEDQFLIPGRSRRARNLVTCYHHHNEVFLPVIDLLAVEMNNRFSESSTALLRYISCLDPRDSFSRFDQHSLICLAELYSDDFSAIDLQFLREDLDTYICEVRTSSDFTSCEDLSVLAIKMVQTGRHLVFPLVYRLIELALILPVATASVERAFSAMKHIKSDLRNSMADEWLNDLMICFIERAIFASIDNEDILQHFQNKENRRIQLPPLALSNS
ncbi:uncharacterized protein LOC126668874 [Mercurialis annua]|uniref:uncharacterized protein LOC126668874 n=1 Tax=Mercurialis annua TaxID=3986 RepID=UPI0021605188|nr:uncharacterized protein LOC126668874 [Mercurialis annua]